MYIDTAKTAESSGPAPTLEELRGCQVWQDIRPSSNYVIKLVFANFYVATRCLDFVLTS